jgi:hypothetical protein
MLSGRRRQVADGLGYGRSPSAQTGTFIASISQSSRSKSSGQSEASVANPIASASVLNKLT